MGPLGQSESAPADDVESGRGGNSEAAPRPQGGRAILSPEVWYVVVLLSLVNVVNYMDRMAFSVLSPAIKRDLALSDAQLGLLSGFAFALFYAACGIPIARWADRGIRRDIIALALAVWSVVTSLGGAARNFTQLFISRVLVGAGEAGGLAPALSILCDYVPHRQRSLVFAVNTLGFYAGIVLGTLIAGWLAESIGWRWAFIVLGVPGVFLAILLRLTLREPERGVFDGKGAGETRLSLSAGLVLLWRRKTFRWLTAFYIAIGFVQYAFGQWWPSFYVRTYSLSLSSIGLYLGLAIAVGSGVGLFLGSFLANYAARRRQSSYLMVGAAGNALALPAVLGSILVSSVVVSLFLVMLTALCWSISNGPAVAALLGVSPPRLRATAGAVSNLLTAALGFGPGPLVVGLLADTLRPTLHADALRYALLLPAMALPLTAVMLYAAAKALPGDLRNDTGTEIAGGHSRATALQQT